MALNRFTESFVGLVKLLENATEGNPANLKIALATSKELESIVRDLFLLHSKIEDHRKNSPTQIIVQAHPEFYKTLVRYEEVWANAWLWQFDDISLDFINEHLTLLDSKEATLTTDREDTEWAFIHERHSAASEINNMFEYISDMSEKSPHFSRSNVAWRWLRDTVGLDLKSIEQRWNEFPRLVVKQGVSDKHGLSEKRSLFAYLKDVRKAYVAGADLAAIAMCRAITEILLKHHFRQGDESMEKIIKRLIQTYPQLAKFNIKEKIDVANFLLHFNSKLDIESNNQAQLTVRNWIEPIQILIDLAPERIET
jgi:hypothetical protein